MAHQDWTTVMYMSDLAHNWNIIAIATCVWRPEIWLYADNVNYVNSRLLLWVKILFTTDQIVGGVVGVAGGVVGVVMLILIVITVAAYIVVYKVSCIKIWNTIDTSLCHNSPYFTRNGASRQTNPAHNFFSDHFVLKPTWHCSYYVSSAKMLCRELPRESMPMAYTLWSLLQTIHTYVFWWWDLFVHCYTLFVYAWQR